MPNPNNPHQFATDVLDHAKRFMSATGKMLRLAFAVAALYVGANFWLMVWDMGGWRALVAAVVTLAAAAWLEVRGAK